MTREEIFNRIKDEVGNSEIACVAEDAIGKTIPRKCVVSYAFTDIERKKIMDEFGNLSLAETEGLCCPVCGSPQTHTLTLLFDNPREKFYCWDCGQALTTR